MPMLLCARSGVDPGFIKGGAQIHCSEHANCVRRHNLAWRLGACPLENFEKLDPLRLNLRALLMVYYFHYFIERGAPAPWICPCRLYSGKYIKSF